MNKITIHMIMYAAGIDLKENDNQTAELKNQTIRLLMTKGINVYCLNFAKNHLHILFKLPLKRTVVESFEIIRYCIESILKTQLNQIRNIDWSDDFIAYSVSNMLVEIEESTIKSQALIHQTKSFEEEANALLYDEIKYYYPQ